VPADDDEPQQRRAAAQPDDSIQAAITWFSTDTTDTRQALRRPGRPKPADPGTLLEEASYDLQFDRLLPGEGREGELVEAQATWLIRRLPPQHRRLSLDSAQQAGRAWGVLITADVPKALPSQPVLTSLARRTGMSMRAAVEIVEQARDTGAAYNRADLLKPYDHAPDEVLMGDWNRLVACGPELPQAADLARDLIELLASRTTGTDDHSWMNPDAREVAHLFATIARSQYLLRSLPGMVPGHGAPDAESGQDRLVALQRQEGALAAAVTAAARAQAVLDWVEVASTPDVIRSHALEAAGPAMRTIIDLNNALDVLAPQDHPGAPVFGPQHVAQVVEAVDRLAARAPEGLRLPDPLPPAAQRPGPHRYDTERRHQPPSPGAGGGAPRQAP